MTFDPRDNSRDPSSDRSGRPNGRRGRDPRGAPRRERPREPLTGEVIPPRPGEPSYFYDAAEPPAEPSLLRNPYLLAGLIVGVAVFLAVVVVIFFGGGDGAATPGQEGIAITPLTPQAGAGIVVKSIATATVRDGPNAEFAAIGTLRSGLDVSVIGRNSDSSWYQILFPQSTLPGWVPASALRVPAQNAGVIPVVSTTPIPRPTVVAPTPTPGPPETETATPTVTGTATPTGGPDLAASAVAGTCAPGRRLIISVTNGGPGAITSRAITVLVLSIDGQQKTIATQTATLPVGGKVDIDTGYTVQERVLAVIDPAGTLGDTNVNNNRVDCIVAGVQPTQPAITGTPTPSTGTVVTVTPTTTTTR